MGSIALAGLIGFCVFGIARAFFAPVKRPGDYGLTQLFLLMYLFAALDVLVSIAIIRGLIRWGISGVRGASVGRVLGIVFLSLGT
ncbi:MAG: hypothetical protein ACRELF_03890, partial [Gemmataceae bacterium]